MNDEMMKEQKIKHRKEHGMVKEILCEDSMSAILSEMYIQQLLQQIPEKARFIIKSIIIEGKTEEEVALKLKMTRQGVSKCKNKYLGVLKQMMNRSA
ncbi:MAG TPA: sigma-70 family RNA polymerase sigma factor [Candidatus Bathyarchaeia archaeon]|nr:sigma-70 family RNA polymerase sigma factor [Candidatus Bathyarchaeia archaeon]